MKRREFLSFAVGAAVGLPLAANAQSGRARRIGLMANLSLLPIERFRERMKQLGYVEGQNLLVEYRFAEGRDELYAGFAQELVSMPVELIVAWGTPAAFAAKRATSKIPVVITLATSSTLDWFPTSRVPMPISPGSSPSTWSSRRNGSNSSKK